MPSKKVDIWMPLYIGDYLSDTMHLTTEQHGAYLLILMAYWKNKGPLRNDPQLLASICRMTVDAWSMSQALLMDFFDTTKNPGKITHHRMEKEIYAWMKKKEVFVNRAKKAARAKWNSRGGDEF